MNTPKVVSGHRRRRRCAAVEAFYGALVEKIVPVGSTGEAELVKLLENTFRHVNIALVNELAMFAGDLDVDIWCGDRRRVDQAVRVHALHAGAGRRRALPADRPVVPRRGGCERRLGHPFRFVELANDVNEHMPDYVVRRITALLNEHSPRGARHPHPAARPRLQGRDLGLARVAVDRGRRTARRRSAPTCARATRTSPSVLRTGPATSSWSTSARRRCATPTSSCCSSTTPSSTPTRSAGTRRSCSTRRASCAGGRSTARRCRRAVHLGILLVCYLKDDDDLPLLELHLERVAKHTHVPTTVFAAANRTSDAGAGAPGRAAERRGVRHPRHRSARQP